MRYLSYPDTVLLLYGVYAFQINKTMRTIIKNPKWTEQNLKNGKKHVGNANGTAEGGIDIMKTYPYFLNVMQEAAFAEIMKIV